MLVSLENFEVSEMASFDEAPPGNPAAGEKIFRTKCAQCHTVDKGAGHKQGNLTSSSFLSLLLFFVHLCVGWNYWNIIRSPRSGEGRRGIGFL